MCRSAEGWFANYLKVIIVSSFGTSDVRFQIWNFSSPLERFLGRVMSKQGN